MKTIRIGSLYGEFGRWNAEFARNSLEGLGLEVVLVPMPSAESENALLCGEVDATVHHLAELPTTQPNGSCIAALSRRADAADCLLISQANYTDNQSFRLQPNAVVGTSSVLQQAQLLDYRPDLQVTLLPGTFAERLAALRAGEVAAIVTSTFDLQRLQPELGSIQTVKMNVREFVPMPGQGVLAYRCCTDDLETRRLLHRQLHQPLVAAATNVERLAQRLLSQQADAPQLGAYCERDTNGYYHVWATLALPATSSGVQRTRLSQSSTVHLAERVLAGLR